MQVQEGDGQSVSAPFVDEASLVEALRRGDEAAFMALVDRYHPQMVRLARVYVSDHAVAEDVAQEAWVGVLRGLDRFEARSSLKTWIFHILVNRAKTRATREGRTVPFSTLDPSLEPDDPSVDPERFLPSDAPQWPNHWSSPPQEWQATPEALVISAETRGYVERAIADLPPAQREVITLRDVEGWPSDEVCNILNISETNQRVLLHRARSKVRGALERYFDVRTDRG